MVTQRFLIGVAAAGLFAIGGGSVLWLSVQSKTGVELPARAPASGAERRAHRERFLGGDPDRDVRGGREMRPRW